MPKNAFGDEIAAPSSGGNVNSFGDPIQGAASATPIAPLPTIKPRALGTINSDMSSLQTHGFSPLSMEDETANSPLAEGHQREAREQYRAPVESDPNLSPVQNVIKNVVAKPLAQMGANSEKAGFGQSALNTLKGFGHSLTSLPEPSPGPNAGADGLQDSPMTGLVTPARQIAAGNYGGAAGTIAGSVGVPLAVAGLTHGVSKGLQNIAPGLYESGVGIRNPDRAYDKTPGQTALEENLRGVHPETVADSATARIKQLVPQRDALLNASKNQVSVNPARQIVVDKQNELGGLNATSEASKLEPITKFLTEADSRFKGSTVGRYGPATQQPTGVLNAQGQPIMKTVPGPLIGQDITPIQPASGAAALKKGLDKELIGGKWNADNAEAHGTAKQVYHQLDQDIDTAVPEQAGLNQRISSLIPVARRAASTARNEDLSGRMASRVAARTGGLMSALAGAAEGTKVGGVGGGVVGGLVGLAAPEFAALPSSKIAAAKTMYGAGNLGEKLAPLIPFLTLKQKEEESEAEKKRVGP